MKVFKIIAIMAGVGFTLGVFSMLISSASQEDEYRARIPAMEEQIQNFVNATDKESIDYYREICLDFIAEIESNSLNSKTIAWAEKNGELIKQTDWDRSEAGIAAKKEKEEAAKKEAKRKNSLSYKKSQVSANLSLNGKWEQQLREEMIAILRSNGWRGYSLVSIDYNEYKTRLDVFVKFRFKDHNGQRHQALAWWDFDYDGNYEFVEVVLDY